MGIGTIDEEIEDFKIMTSEERKSYLRECFEQAKNNFRETKASFIPEIQALVDACALQKVGWWDCDFGGKKLLGGLAYHIALISGMAEEEADSTFPNFYQLNDIKRLYENLGQEYAYCCLPSVYVENGTSLFEL